jgi:hypothetical protein
VPHALVEPRQKALRLRRHDRALVVDAGERADRVERLPEGDDEELDLVAVVTPEKEGVRVAVDGAQRRERLRSQVLLVRGRELRRRPTSPVTRDHMSRVTT